MLNSNIEYRILKQSLSLRNSNVRNIGFRIFFTTIFLLFFVLKSYALNLDKLKAYFIGGDYKAAIKEGEKIMAGSKYCEQMDELYYLLGLSYLKDGNYLRAADIFEIIIKEFKKSDFKQEAKMGLGDSCFLKGDYDSAKQLYNGILKDEPDTKLKSALYYRLSQSAFKEGDSQEAGEYLQKIKKDFPLNLEAKQGNFSNRLTTSLYYTVQVGSFSSDENAKNFMQELKKKGYPAYIEKAESQGVPVYRVRVGKLPLLQEAESFQKRLSQEGYSTKIYP